MDKTFETMVQEATVAWPMIMHLDNKDNIGPKSESGNATDEFKEFASENGFIIEYRESIGGYVRR